MVPAVSLETKLASLRRGQTYGEEAAQVQFIETHMSWVFLTPRHAYKLKKPVRTEFLDFSTIEARRKDGLEELRLNRRLAPHVYLGLVPLAVSPSGELSLNQAGEPIDWLVKMRRLPAERMLDHMIRNATVHSAEIERVASILGQFYASAPRITMNGTQYRARLTRRIGGSVDALSEPAYGLSAPTLNNIRQTLERFLARNPDLLETRTRHVVEGHGDLRPEHICLERRPVIFDCLEFNHEYRILDAADELAFLDMECECLGNTDIGPMIFGIYSAITGDRPPEPQILFYKATSACVRAMLAVWHLRDVEEGQRRHWLDHAARYVHFSEGWAQRLEG